MKNRKIIISSFFLIISLSASYSADIRVQRREQQKKVFKDHYFEIAEPQNWQYTLNDTSERTVKAHRWANDTKDYLIEIRVAEDFVHLNFYALKDFYIENTKDFINNLKLIFEKQQKLNDKWIWNVEFTGNMVDNKKVKINLFIVTNRHFAYFISVIFPLDKKITIDQINAVNSINYF